MPPEKSRKADKPLTHKRLGWTGRLFHEPTPNVIMSEDGLFPQTSAMLVRMSPWSFWALQKARALALQTPAIAQHPWKERVQCGGSSPSRCLCEHFARTVTS